MSSDSAGISMKRLGLDEAPGGSEWTVRRRESNWLDFDVLCVLGWFFIGEKWSPT